MTANQKIRRDSGAPAIPKTKLALAVASAVLASAVTTSANAQVLSIEEVTVTATKREESAQDVPLAITALSGDFSQKVNINDVKDLVSFTPGVTGNSQDSFIDAISVRGIRTQDFGVGGDPSAAFFKNDLYEGRNGSAVTSMYDMERSEILRGPQGFLFGRNSIGGAFSVHTRKAQVGDSTTGYIETDIAQRGHFAVEGAVNLPVNDNFAMRLAGYSSQEDGFVKNHYPGSDDLIEHDKKAVRWSTTYESDQLTINTVAEFEDRKQSGSVYRAIEKGEIWDSFEAAIGDVNLRGGRGDADSDQTLGDNDKAKVATFGIHAEYDFGELVLTSNTGYKDHDYFYTEDYDGTPLNVLDYQQDQTGDYFQQEFRLASDTDGPLSWYAGVSYYKEEIDAEFTFASSEDIMCQYYGNYYNGMTFSGCADLYAYYGSPFSPSADGRLIETGRVKGSYSGWASYVDLDYAITDALSLGIGVRYTKDTKDFALSVPTPDSDLGAYWAYGFSTDGFLTDNASWDKVTSRAIAKYQFEDGGMLFASFTEGFKAGGFGTFNLGNDADGNPAIGNLDIAQGDGFAPNKFAPELVDSWEIGYKNTLFDGRANFDVSAFTYDYTDLQVVVADGGGAIIKNAGNVNAHGVESSITAVITDNFNVLFNLGWMDSEATGIQGICATGDDACEGSPLFWAPEWSGAMVLDAHFPLGAGMLTGSLEVFWEGERGGGWEGLDTTMIDSYQDLTLRVGYESDSNWRVDAYAENLTNEFTWDGLNNNGGVLPSHFFGPKRPRTLGLRFGMDFD
ncbi:iron complex outermembrane recepter protein [Microbulbifer donghaiensis]|uniref:Iron complex outermembrane recepter protein n=1 Tax=Microbulbifer donghaiensis TaxID=494016 RepID=A0A1M5AUW2_9GAMM|nr:TonB-dependent receptor [Microbulbifer donghaiensis]SHF34010.1 iron complex outermembrane recepter protein [Microbulbifer donghaiensis]